MGELINTEDLEHIIELAILSGWIKNTVPLSVLVTADKVGAGKTDIIKQYRNVDSCAYETDVTAFGIETKYLDAIKAGYIRHLLVGDLLSPFSKQRKTRDSFVMLMNSVIEEGVVAITKYNIMWETDEPVRCGLITTIPRDDLMFKARRWGEVGFLSRCIPVSYSYSSGTKAQIYRSIVDSKEIEDPPIKNIWLPKVPVPIKQAPEHSVKFVELSIRTEEATNVYGFRRQKQFQTLLMAEALRNAHYVVRESDAAEIMRLSKYINLDYSSI